MLRAVLIVQRRLSHYRVLFFEALRLALNQRGVSLRVAHENKLVCNLFPQFLNTSVRFALWGHGRNLQGSPTSLHERFRCWSAERADWWFAYTDRSRDVVLQSGFPFDHFTVLNNSIDTCSVAELRAAVTPETQLRLRQKIGLQGANIGVYVGSLSTEKRVKFMLDAAVKVRLQVPDFEFLMIGAGPHTPLVAAFCQQHPWAHALGVQRGAEMVALVSLARVMLNPSVLNPGAVGLTMVDSFACQVPLFTTDCGLHGPEIDCLISFENGVMTDNSVAAYSDAVVQGLTDTALGAHLQAGCALAAERYTMEGMVEQFVSGVMRCLQKPVRRRRLAFFARPVNAS